jgi:hypothetical protein
MPNNLKHFTNKLYPTQQQPLTPLKPMRQMQMQKLTAMTMIIKGASASGPPRTSSTHPLMVVSTLEWDG